MSGETPLRPDGSRRPSGPLAADCPNEVAKGQDRTIREADPDVVVWWDRFSLSGFRSADGDNVRAGTREYWATRRAMLDETVRRLGRRGAVVAFVATEPPAESVLDRCLHVGCDWPQFQIAHYDDLTARWNELLRAYADDHPERAVFVSITDAICREDVAPCDDRIGGVTARRDGIHYEGAGEERVIEALLERLGPLMERYQPAIAA